MVTIDQELLVERRGGVAEVRLNRPERLNALSSSVQQRLVEVFAELDRDDSVRAVTLGSTSRKAFSVGADLKEMAAGDDAGARPYEPMHGTTRNVYETVLECRKPTIAVLDGWVVGGGMELAMACDIRIASHDARFLLPEAKVGLGANFGSQMLPRLVAATHAFEILYGAEPFDAEHAERIGFVSRAVQADELEEDARRTADLIASRAPVTIRRYKAMVNLGSSLPIAAALRLDPGPSPYFSQDRAEGARAFREKREPIWSGR
ncbi:enoyl-CoA hydratase/isomerase family protein [Aeromicrobium tamlense]|uniref:Enoyl-CoA hydratase/carnithine racemase n=1 Tax=Aeromicrobium tamlense TaxID=375541 RepID=A0ABX2SI71_9ACTN|nr:enoyl-CoA hydratase/isomerase family protein [Aeromicrobium tamlense]NYI37478.1 enoyl-CoA hydratase/carnithine racemase [Aeromicrobium tamlense]